MWKLVKNLFNKFILRTNSLQQAEPSLPPSLMALQSLRLTLPQGNFSRFLYHKRHAGRDDVEAPTLFVVNVPELFSEGELAAVYAPFGNVTAVKFGEFGGKGPAFAHVIFDEEAAVDRALASEHESSVAPAAEEVLGLEKWMAGSLVKAERDALRDEADDFMNSYDEAEAEVRRAKAEWGGGKCGEGREATVVCMCLHVCMGAAACQCGLFHSERVHLSEGPTAGGLPRGAAHTRSFSRSLPLFPPHPSPNTLLCLSSPPSPPSRLL